MDIKLEQYRIFNAVAEHASFSKAAEKLFVTQSAVSQAIKQLEEALGVALFLRSPKGIIPTPEGKILYQHTSAALDLLASGNKRLESFRELTDGELRIGANDTLSSYFLLEKLEEFHKAYPGIKIEVINRVTKEAVELVKSGRIDLAFGNLPIDDDSLEIHSCLEVHDIFVAGKGFEHLKEKSLSRKEISQLPLILLEKKSNSRNYVDRVFLESGSRLSANIELGAHELLLQFAQIGLGISCVVKEFSKKYLDDSSVFEIDMRKPIPPRSIGFCYPKKLELSHAARKFIDTIG